MRHQVRARRRTAATATLLGVALTACGSPAGGPATRSLAGTHVEVVAAWSGGEQAQFRRVLAAFASKTGARVRYVSAAGDVPAVLDARFRAHDPPDVALLPQPGLLRHYARDHRLVPVDEATRRLVRSEYSPAWTRLASVGAQLYGVWFKAADKSLLWYDVAVFERLGVAPPAALSSLPATATAVLRAGYRPFAVGGRDQWTLTDWFENLYLQLAGPLAYERLAAHREPWTDPSVVRCLALMARLLSPQNLRGGVAGTLRTGFDDSVALAFGTAPPTAMVMEGDFVAGAVTSRTRAQLGVDVDAVPFPAARAGGPEVVGGGDVAVELRATPAARALLHFLATPGAAAVWARAGGFLSANADLDLSVYPDRLTRSIARSLVEAGDGFHFDLSDLQPAAFGSTPGAGMQQALADLLRSHDVVATSRRLERLAVAAYAAEPR